MKHHSGKSKRKKSTTPNKNSGVKQELPSINFYTGNLPQNDISIQEKKQKQSFIRYCLSNITPSSIQMILLIIISIYLYTVFQTVQDFASFVAQGTENAVLAFKIQSTDLICDSLELKWQMCNSESKALRTVVAAITAVHKPLPATSALSSAHIEMWEVGILLSKHSIPGHDDTVTAILEKIMNLKKSSSMAQIAQRKFSDAIKDVAKEYRDNHDIYALNRLAKQTRDELAVNSPLTLLFDGVVNDLDTVLKDIYTLNKDIMRGHGANPCSLLEWRPDSACQIYKVIEKTNEHLKGVRAIFHATHNAFVEKTAALVVDDHIGFYRVPQDDMVYVGKIISLESFSDDS